MPRNTPQSPCSCHGSHQFDEEEYTEEGSGWISATNLPFVYRLLGLNHDDAVDPTNAERRAAFEALAVPDEQVVGKLSFRCVQVS